MEPRLAYWTPWNRYEPSQLWPLRSTTLPPTRQVNVTVLGSPDQKNLSADPQNQENLTNAYYFKPLNFSGLLRSHS